MHATRSNNVVRNVQCVPFTDVNSNSYPLDGAQVDSLNTAQCNALARSVGLPLSLGSTVEMKQATLKHFLGYTEA